MRLLPGIMHTALTWQSGYEAQRWSTSVQSGRRCKCCNANHRLRECHAWWDGYLGNVRVQSGTHSCNAMTPSGCMFASFLAVLADRGVQE